jgi:hypothetical protein
VLGHNIYLDDNNNEDYNNINDNNSHSNNNNSVDPASARLSGFVAPGADSTYDNV